MSNDDKNTSDFRRLLQEKLANNEAAGEGWNVPSGGVWTGLSEELSSNRTVLTDHRKSIWPWVAIGLLAVALLVRECSHFQTVGQMERELLRVQQDCEEKLSQRNKKQPESNSGTIPLAMGASPVAFHESESPNDHVPLKGNRPNRLTKAVRAITEQTKLTQPVSTQAQKEPLKVDVKEEAMAELNLEQSDLRLAEAVPTPLTAKDLAFLQTKNRLPNLPKNLGIPVSKAKGIGLAASFFNGLAITGNRLSGEKPTIISDQKALMAWQTGLGLEVVINRNWTVLTGLNYQTSRIETDYDLAVPFTHNGEFQHDDGNYDNQYNHSLPSSLGNYPLQMVLTRASDATIHEGEVMDLALRIKQKTEFLSLPLQLRYGLGKNRWQMGIRAGAIANHVLAVASETPDLKPLHTAIHQRHTSIGAPALADLEKWTFDYAFGLDFRYSLLPRLALSMSTGYQRGFTPVYEDDAVKNHLQSFNMGLGLHYRLR